MEKKVYRKLLRRLQIELVRFQRRVIESNEKILVIFEGRDAAGKDGTIKRIVEHTSPRETRVVALGKPSDRDRSAWYFQRFVPQLPVEQEIVLFNRSWYNRAGVERVMGFCNDDQYHRFLSEVGQFEKLLSDSGIRLIKFYLDISRLVQAKRLASRRTDPLKQWKVSPIDAVALEKWDDYSVARDEMLAASHTAHAPWIVVRADDKRRTRINVIRHLLQILGTSELDPEIREPEDSIIFEYSHEKTSQLAP